MDKGRLFSSSITNHMIYEDDYQRFAKQAHENGAVGIFPHPSNIEQWLKYSDAEILRRAYAVIQYAMFLDRKYRGIK